MLFSRGLNKIFLVLICVELRQKWLQF